MLRGCYWLAIPRLRALIGPNAHVQRVGRTAITQWQRSPARFLSGFDGIKKQVDEEVNRNKSFRDSLNKLKNEGKEQEGAAESGQEAAQGGAEGASDTARTTATFTVLKGKMGGFWEGLKDTSRELFGMKKPSRVTQRLRSDDEDEEADDGKQKATADGKMDEAKEGEEEEEEYQGDPLAGTAIQVVKDARGYWDRLVESLRHAPMIEDIMETGRLLSKTEVGQQATKATHAVKDKVGDAKEYWETTQNPVVVTLASMWDSVTRETDQGIAIRELRRLDPAFTLEEWTEDVMENLVPVILDAHVKGNSRVLRKWLGEAVYNKLNAEITQRKAEGVQLDERILAIEEANVINLAYEEGTGQSPIIVLQFMVQQIHCIRKHGEIVEGREDEVNANYYVMAFQREYNEVDRILQWKIVDMMLAGKFPYW